MKVHLDSILYLVGRRRIDEALAAFEVAVGQPETRLAALGHRAWLFRTLGRYDEAVADYTALLKEDPGNRDARALRAETRLMSGEIDEAVAEAVEVLQTDPLNEPAVRVLVSARRSLGSDSVSPEPNTAESGGEPMPALNPVIAKLEADAAGFPISSAPEVGRLLYALVRCLRPNLVLETGAFIGYSSLCIAQGLEHNGRGHLHSFDLFKDRGDYISPVPGVGGDGLQIARGHLEQAGLAERVTFYAGDSSDTIRRHFGGERHRFDMAFIDGDHTLNGCLRDWRAVDELLGEGGVVLLHDTEPEACGWLGPRGLLEALKRDPQGNYETLSLPTPDGFGFGMAHKLADEGGLRWRPSVFDLIAERLFHEGRARR